MPPLAGGKAVALPSAGTLCAVVIFLALVHLQAIEKLIIAPSDVDTAEVKE